MKYSIKYANCKNDELVESNIIYKDKKDNCYICSSLTNFIDTDFGAYICSEECNDAITNEYIKRGRLE